MERKTEVYAWRVSPAVKTSLEEAARASNQSVAQLLDAIVGEHLAAARAGESDADHQRRLHARVRRFAGRLSGGVARRSDRARELVRARLRRRQRAD